MLFKLALACAVFAVSKFLSALPETVPLNDLEFLNKGIECVGECGSHRDQQQHRCCGCPRKGAVAKVKTLNTIFFDLYSRQNPDFFHLIDPKAQIFVQGNLEAQNFCCTSLFDLESS